MTPKKNFVFLAVLTGLAIVQPAMAKEWSVDYSHSHLGFVGTQGSTPFEGEFKRFEAVINFDPQNPETGKISSVIDISSITAGSMERDSYLPQSDWFDTKTFPGAQFVSTSIHKTGENAYVAQGQLTIKGITQSVSLPFTLKQEGNHWRAKGELTLMRTDFHIGSGDWSNEDYVKHAVNVIVDLAATTKN